MINNLYQWFLASLKPKDKNRSLRKYSIFKDLNSFELHLLKQIIHHRKYTAGEILFEDKYPLELIFLIEKGEVAVFGKLQPNGSRTLKRGQFIGLIDMYHENSRSSSAKAVKDSEILAISRTDFQQFLETNPRTGIKILSGVCTNFSNFMFDLVEEFEAKE